MVTPRVKVKEPEYKCIREVEIANLQKDNEYFKKDNEEFHKFFFGNGKPGFLRDMTEMQTYMKDMPDIKKQLEQLIVLKNLEEEFKKDKKENEKDERVNNSAMWQRRLMVAGIFCSMLIGLLGYFKSSSNATDRANTVVTNPATIKEATGEGKSFKIPASEMKKEENKNLQKEINSINK
jgi:hypothetical protein